MCEQTQTAAGAAEYETEVVAEQVQMADVLIVENDLGHEEHEEVRFLAWADDGDRLIWTDSCALTEPARMDPATPVRMMGDA